LTLAQVLRPVVTEGLRSPRETNACTAPERANPRTRAHGVSQNMENAASSPCQTHRARSSPTLTSPESPRSWCGSGCGYRVGVGRDVDIGRGSNVGRRHQVRGPRRLVERVLTVEIVVVHGG